VTDPAPPKTDEAPSSPSPSPPPRASSSPSSSPSPSSPGPRALEPAGAAAAVLLGFAAVALVDAIAGPLLARPATIALLVKREIWGVSAILLAGVAIAVDSAILVAAGRHLGASLAPSSKVGRALPYAFLAAFHALVATAFLTEFLARQAGSFVDGTAAKVLLAMFVAGFGVGLAVLVAIANALAHHRWLRIVPVVGGLGGAIYNHLFLRDDYADVHTAIGWVAAVGFGFGVAPSVASLLAHRPRVVRTLVAVTALWAALGVVAPAPNDVRLELFRSPGSGAYALALAVWRLPELPPPVPHPGQEAFYTSREGLAAIAPTARPREGGAPVVVFITIDAFRADLLQDRKKDALWPTLAKLRDESVVFTRARSPGTQTAISLSAVFSGKFFSQLYWRKGPGDAGLDYPAEDPSPRFTTLLDQAGVATAKSTSVQFLQNDFGVAPGFKEELYWPKDRKSVMADKVLPPLLARLERASDEPLFVYSHFMEAHGPYTSGRRNVSATGKVIGLAHPSGYVMYVGSVAALDDVVAKILAACERPNLAGRVLFIVSADHGEGFGEHGAFQHGKTLYAEMTEVPLFVRGPGLTPHVVDDPVTLVDVGPTVLDWMGVATPGSYMGQSLVPALLGRKAELSRPIVAEGRLRRSLIVGDVKIVVDERNKVVEAFDVAKDPGERVNLWDTDRERALPAAAAYRAFFEAHTLKREGYTPPYRP
jgi:hypothetical protein